MVILEHGQAQARTLLFFPCTAEPVWAFAETIALLSKTWHVLQAVFDGHQPEYPGDFTSVEQTVDEVDFTKSRNVLVAALILVLSIGISYSSAGSLALGPISLSGLAVGSIVGIVLNAIMPGKDYVYGEDKQGDESVNFIVQ